MYIKALVQRNGPWKEMERLGFEEGFISITQEMYEGYKCRAKVPYHNSD